MLANSTLDCVVLLNYKYFFILEYKIKHYLLYLWIVFTVENFTRPQRKVCQIQLTFVIIINLIYLFISMFTISIVCCRTHQIVSYSFYVIILICLQLLEILNFLVIYRFKECQIFNVASDFWTPLYLSITFSPMSLCHSILLVISPAYILWKRPYMSTKQWEERQSHWVNCPSFTADGCWQYVNGSVCFWVFMCC